LVPSERDSFQNFFSNLMF